MPFPLLGATFDGEESLTISGFAIMISLLIQGLSPVHLESPDLPVDTLLQSLDCDFQVSGFLDRSSPNPSYIPLVVQIFNQGERALEIQVGQFTLETKRGNRFKPISLNHFQSRFRADGILHKKMMEVLPGNLNRQKDWKWVDSRFYPLRGANRFAVKLAPGEYLYDVLYFDAPREHGLVLEWQGMRRSLAGSIKP